MHIPDGYLGPETIAAGWALTVPVWYRGQQAHEEAAFAAPDDPRAGLRRGLLVSRHDAQRARVAGGTTAHAVGAVLIAVIAGPEVACLAVSAALVIQALLLRRRRHPRRSASTA